MPPPQLPLTQVVAPQLLPLATHLPTTQQPPPSQRLPSQHDSPSPPHDWQVLVGMPLLGMHWVPEAVHTDGLPRPVRQHVALSPPQLPHAPLSPHIP